ncbi:uncharacterized protein [Primulina eburnea]|uniref:uncharacterized protein n=1 Tax=Primulina eburnea TaxID=1245227 RepID=UPI003C6C126C
MGKSGTIDKFFKRKIPNQLDSPNSTAQSIASDDNLPPEVESQKFRKVENIGVDLNLLERDPGLRRQIWEYSPNEQEEIRRAYLNLKAFQPILSQYPLNKNSLHPRRFQSSWYELFPWLEYSLAKDKAFCFPCFIFNKPSGCPKQTAFTVEENACDDLMNQHRHIQRFFDKVSSETVARNRLRLKVGIHVVRLLALQGVPFRGHDESSNSSNRGNFLEFLDIVALYNDELSCAIEKAPKNAKYTCHDIQKQILHMFSIRMKNIIREEIVGSKYCIVVDEARDESKREQLSIVLRFVDKDGCIQERFFGLVHVSDTTALTLKIAIYFSLAHYNLDVQNIRGQGYDGASNMRGEFNGLQALILKDCKSAYYVHCFAHRLQLALVGEAKNVTPIHQFFDKLTFIVNIVGASCKRNDELKEAHTDDIAHLISINELETGRGLNQLCTLQRAADTRWSSHFRYVSSLIKMFSASCTVLLKVMEDGLLSQRADATSVYDEMTSFDFVFILHLMREIMEITDVLCQTLQRKSPDILNAMELVSSTKKLLQELRDDKCDNLLEKVKSFCVARNIDVPDFSAQYVDRRGRARRHQGNFTIEHHYRVDLFYATIDSQMQEINVRFNEDAVELLMLSSALNPQNACDSLRYLDICKLVENFYPQDFTSDEKERLEMQLKHYEHNVVIGPYYKRLSILSELCQWLVKTKKADIYDLVFRVIVLVLTLPVFTATTERSFSAMNIVKTRLRSKMKDAFLSDALMIFIEREIAKNICIDTIMKILKTLRNVEFLLVRNTFVKKPAPPVSKS